MMHKGWRPRRTDEGSSLVEFALMSLVFVMFLLGIVEMGRMVLVYTTVANAARAGARYAIVHGGERSGAGVNGPSSAADYSQIQTVVQNFASAGLLDTSRLVITVAYPDTVNTAGSRVTVTVSYPYDPLVGYFSSILNTTMGSTSQGVIAF